MSATFPEPPPPRVADRRPMAEAPAQGQDPGAAEVDPILCRHCGRTASNGISCEGICVADSGY